jgi:hypothetical protein
MSIHFLNLIATLPKLSLMQMETNEYAGGAWGVEAARLVGSKKRFDRVHQVVRCGPRAARDSCNYEALSSQYPLPIYSLDI